MNEADKWKSEIESLSKENSARILSVVLGVTEGEAADRILEYAPEAMGARTGFSQAVTMARVLGTKLHTASKIQPHRTGIRSGVEFTDKFPKVHKWLERNPDRMAILRAGSSFYYVGYGVILAMAGMISTRRVTHVIFLDEE